MAYPDRAFHILVYFIVVCAICHRTAGEEGGAGVRGIAVASHVSVGDVGNSNENVIVQEELVNSSRCFPRGECEAIVARRLPFIGGSGGMVLSLENDGFMVPLEAPEKKASIRCGASAPYKSWLTTATWRAGDLPKSSNPRSTNLVSC